MKIGKRFNTLSFSMYFVYIDNHKKYTDFNTLGLYRSLLENDKLSLEQRIELRDYAHGFFRKSYDFLQLKDPHTYVDLQLLGKEMTWDAYRQFWSVVRKNQEAILKKKRIKHRNFGVYSKHECGMKNCPYDGVMFKQKNHIKDAYLRFEHDKCEFEAKRKSDMAKWQRKNSHRIIDEDRQADAL